MMTKHNGYSLIELMIATSLATLMSLGVLGIFVNQTNNIRVASQRDNTAEQTTQTFDLLSRLLRQADFDNVTINYPAGAALNAANELELTDDGITVDLLLPPGFRIWPNDVAPFDNNAIRLKWHNKSDDSSPHTIQITNANSLAALSNDNLIDLAGSNGSDQLARIINLDVWPMQDLATPQADATGAATGGYLLRVTTRSAQQDISYINPDDPEDSLKHYRTYSVSGIIFPRN